jgi:hypothetical protein
MTKDDALEKKAENARELGLDYEPDPVAWAHHSTFKNLNSFEQSRYSATLAKKQTNACCIPLYTTPPQRTWVGLTPEERDHIWNTVGNSDAHGDVDGRSGEDVMDAIEAKLKEKNT